MKQRDFDLLTGIVEVAGNIEGFASRGREELDREVLVQYAVAHALVLTGEAAGKLSMELRERYPDVPWRQIVALRNIVVHEYDRIDLDVVWDVVEREVPRLAERVRTILAGDPAEPDGDTARAD